MIERIDFGNRVLCDLCTTDYTDRTETGGLLLQSRAVCPECVPGVLRDAILYNEQRFIRARCPEGMEFRAWVLGLRGGDNEMRIYTGDDFRRLQQRSGPR
jgi:hypothetical protein